MVIAIKIMDGQDNSLQRVHSKIKYAPVCRNNIFVRIKLL